MDNELYISGEASMRKKTASNYGDSTGYSTGFEREFPLRLMVRTEYVGAIIGRGGCTIKEIAKQSRARIDVRPRVRPYIYSEDEPAVQMITVYGSPENISVACLRILEIMQQEASNTTQEEVSLQILAHCRLIGRVIGKNGLVVKKIMETTGTRITTVRRQNPHNTNCNVDHVITIEGQIENIWKAEQMISKKLRQSYENDLKAMSGSNSIMFPAPRMTMMTNFPHYGFSYPDVAFMPPQPAANGLGSAFSLPRMPPLNVGPLTSNAEFCEDTYMYIPNSTVGAVIGIGGSNIKKMMVSANCVIKINPEDKEEPNDRDTLRRVTFTGALESQWEAQLLISNTIQAYFRLPDPPVLKVEIIIPSYLVGRLIGKGGQTIKKLQRRTRSNIKVIKNVDATENDEVPVHIYGDACSTYAAQVEIRMLLNTYKYIPPPPPPIVEVCSPDCFKYIPPTE